MQSVPRRFQSICRWSFHAGKGGFVPAVTRPGFQQLSDTAFAELIANKIIPRIPENTHLGLALHYDKEINEKTAELAAQTLKSLNIAISMVTPGMHYHWGYGGLASPCPKERADALAYCKRTIDIALGPLSVAEHPECPIVIDIWNGAFGYELPSIVVRDMVKYADDGIAELTEYVLKKDSRKKVGVEPKANEGHAAMIYQTSGDVLALRGRLARRGIDISRFGLINEFGHTEMIGLDVVQDYAAADLEGAIVHVHANSQGGDGVRLGGAGKFDIDFGVAPSATTIGIAQILLHSSYDGWIEHDMQPRAHDSEQQNIDRVVRSVCNWEAICRVLESGFLDTEQLRVLSAEKQSMAVEDMLRDTVNECHARSKELYERTITP